MVHTLPLPGSPGWRFSMDEVIDAALADAESLIAGGCDGIIVENMHDLPYLKGGVDPETTAAMALVTGAITGLGTLPVGVQILAGANREALGVAVTCGAAFIRAEAFAYAHVADEGWLDASAGPLLRARAALGAREKVAVWADVKKKHAAHALTSDIPLDEYAKGAAFCGADALIVTGPATGAPTQANDIALAKAAGLPVVVGSGVDAHSAAALGKIADALIVGTALKKDGAWTKPVDVDRVRTLAEALASQ
jgi:membrane complex biogenesis BtpA family protein